jgi:hypothetical protein
LEEVRQKVVSVGEKENLLKNKVVEAQSQKQ